MLLDLQKGIIYGPIYSRRLGRSLGINLLPSNQKACPFNCVYCQYGWTKIHRAWKVGDVAFPSVGKVRKALIDALVALKRPPSYITFSGNGEPTLHPEFGRMVHEVKSIRSELAPQAKTAILSNSALVSRKHIRKSIQALDVRIMKLDCGTPRMFRKYNQPCSGIDLEDITEDLTKIPGVTIQTLVSSGPSGNFQATEIKEWIERMKRIKPIEVQLYTVDRDYPEKNLKPAKKEYLYGIKAQSEKAGIPARVYENRSLTTAPK
jgi:wyosine [tRNA(Phe)-imidazoG37] synthetase (radical SAM superfamily)